MTPLSTINIQYAIRRGYFKVQHSGQVQETRMMNLLIEDVQCVVLKEEEAGIVQLIFTKTEG